MDLQNYSLNNQKVELLRKLVTIHPDLEALLEELLKIYGSDNYIDNFELDDIFEKIEGRINELKDEISDEKANEVIEEIKEAKDPEAIEEISNSIDQEVATIVESSNIAPEEPIEETVEEPQEVEEEKSVSDYNYDYNQPVEDSKREQYEALENAYGGIPARMFPENKTEGYPDTFMIEVSDNTQHIIDSLLQMAAFSYACSFDIYNGKYVFTVRNFNELTHGNVADFSSMVQELIRHTNAKKGVDYRKGYRTDIAEMQERFQKDNPVANDLYDKQNDHKVFGATIFSDHAIVQDEINESRSNNTLGYEENGGQYNIVGSDGIIQEDVTKEQVEHYTGAKINEAKPKVLTKSLGSIYKLDDAALVSAATLVLGLGLGIGMIVLFIVFA